MLVDQSGVEGHEHIAAHGVGLVDFPPRHQLADHLGKAEPEDYEEHARYAQGKNPDDEREQGVASERRGEGRVQRHHLDEPCDRIHADAEEGRGGERDQPRRARKQCPGHGQHEIAHYAEHEGQGVVGQQRRQCREQDDERDERPDGDPGADGKSFGGAGHFRAFQTGRAASPRARSGTARKRPRASVRNRHSRNTVPRRRRTAGPPPGCRACCRYPP